MSEPFISPIGYKTKKVTLLISIILGITLTGILVLGGFRIKNYRSIGGVPKMSSAPAQVAISSPQHGSKIFLCDTIPVDVVAIGPTAYESIELWLDGELAGIQTASVGGGQPFITRFAYHPPEGYHALMAVGVDANGQKVFSAQSVVLVVQDEEECNVDTIEIAFPGDEGGSTLGSYTSPVLPGEGDSIKPAGVWAGTLGDLATSLTADTKPAAPELAVRPRECAASLFIHDLSDNEEGFLVYRQVINTPSWELMATLSSQFQVEWLEYVDEGISGVVTYYVSAFNSQGETKSNPVLVNVDPEGCLDKGEPTIVESVSVVLELNEVQAEQVYCYISRDGENWSRWPTAGFLYPDEEGVFPELPIMVQRKSSPAAEDGAAYPGLMMECWDWQNGALSKLGEIITGELQPDKAGQQMLIGKGILAKLSYKAEAANDGAIYPVGLKGVLPPLLELDPALALQPPLTPVDPDLPRVNLSFTFDPEVCGQHIPPEAQNALGIAMFCFPYPVYDPDQGASFPQPYLVWGFDFEPTCAGGMGENCKSYWELLSMAEETGGQVGFTITAIAPGIKQVWNVTDSNLTMFVVPPMACVGDLEYTARIWYRPGSQGTAVAVSPDQQISEINEVQFSPAEILYGPISHPVKLPCVGDLFTPTIIEYYKEISVVFNDIYFYDLDDGGAEGITGVADRSVELYGYLRVKAPSTGYWATEYCFNEWTGNCDQEPYWTGTSHYLLVADWEEDDDDKLNTVMLGSNSNLPVSEILSGWDLCMASSKHSCKYQGNKTGYAKDNNILTVEVKKDDTLTISMRLVDYDELSDDDDVCIGSDSIPAEWFIDMERWETREFVVAGDLTDSGRCVLYGEIEIISNWLLPIP